ncbi:hypothetical protein [Microbulbifer sp. ZKSA002]|uniref:hypothetical protein n=1 Tax=Microbulbifer sp. ZKSA002 TaxID=3243388 RepID=UPI0040392106
MKKLLICIILLLVACNESSNIQSSEFVDFALADKEFSVPSKYILPSLPSAIVSQKKLDAGGGVSLKIPLRDLGLPTEGDVVVFLSAPSEFVSEFGVSIDAFNAWNGIEVYSERIIEKDESYGLYRVGSEAGYPMFWHYFNTMPSTKDELDRVWVASCYEAVKGNPTCSKQFVFIDTENKLTISGLQIESLSDIEKAYRALLRSWEQ